MAKIMMTIVAVLIILSIPKMVLALYEVTTIPNILDCYRRKCNYYITSKRWVADIIVRYLVMLNSSTNFLVYCFFGSNFRRTLLSYLKSEKHPKEALNLIADEETDSTIRTERANSTIHRELLELATILNMLGESDQS